MLGPHLELVDLHIHVGAAAAPHNPRSVPPHQGVQLPGATHREVREFPLELNEILVKKAVKYKARGVVGIDLAGPEVHTLELSAEVEGYRDLFARARAAGLGTTVHTGETSYTAVPGVLAVLDKLAPARIGHGIAPPPSPEATRQPVESGAGPRIRPNPHPPPPPGARPAPPGPGPPTARRP